ncbi:MULTISPECIES: LysE family translocator [Myxococcus]|nr:MULTISPECIES: LysE family transporter [Myxococcus]NTX54810.1 LysE family transporter [Myxococcus sp. CA039A]
MDALMGVAGLVAVSAITPGPNNMVVMRAGGRGGVVGALPAIAGVVLGTAVLLTLLMTSVGVAFAADPRVGTAITRCGGLYLVWLGARLIAGSLGRGASGGDTPTRASSDGFIGTFVLQFLNPKSWVTVLTAASAVRSGASAAVAFIQLVVLFTVIPVVCLLLWSTLGSLMSTVLARESFRRAFDAVMGGLLIASAVLLVSGA